MSTTLHDKLQRLRRTGSDGDTAAPRPPDSLAALERTLGGGAAENLPLRARLERLVAIASKQRPRVEARPDRILLEEAIQGFRRQNERGEFFVAEHDVHVETFHGEQSLSRLSIAAPEDVGLLSGDPSLRGFDMRRAAFLDTETTGLAGGTGTAAFLIGVGFLDGDRFRVRQYFMRDYHEEAALLHALADDVGGFDFLVTFNGKMFDVPLLETRYRLMRSRSPLEGTPHLDLLHPARRLWKLRLESCRLTALESALLGVRRHGDVPGEEIPWIYFDYVRRRDARALKRVFDHNRIDIVSLAALSLYACEWVREERAEDPRDAYSLARVLDRAGLYDRAATHYERAAEAGGDLQAPALIRLARHARQRGDEGAAARLWSQAAEAGEPLAFKALAIHYERRERDLDRALDIVNEGLACLAGRSDPRSRRVASELARRAARLRERGAVLRRDACARRVGESPP